MITCKHCKKINPPEQQRCQNCGRDLLPGRGAGLRLGVLLISLAVGAFGAFILVKMAQGAELPDLGCVFTSPLYWVILTIVVPIMGLVYALQRTPTHEKYVDRAKRHFTTDPEQALADFTRALNLAPEKQKASILKERARLLTSLGRETDAVRDKIAYMDSEGAYQGAAGFATMIGADRDTLVDGVKSTEQQEMVKSHSAVGLGWCKKCKAMVELDEAMHCPIHPTTRITDLHLAVPEEATAEKAHLQEVVSRRNRALRIKRLLALIILLLVVVALCYITNQ